MSYIVDTINQALLATLQRTLLTAIHANVCPGSFNLHSGRKLMSAFADWLGGSQNCCCLLISMQGHPLDELPTTFGFS